LWTLIFATLLYIGTATAILVAVPLEPLANSEAPMSLVFANAPEAIRQGFALIAVVATVNGVLIQMIMASRVLYGLAHKGHLPAMLKRVSPRTRTPSIATLVVIGAIILLTQAFPIAALAEHASQIVLFVFILVNIALIWLKTGVRSDRHHFTVPMVVPLLGVASSLPLFAAFFL
jgi:amino acid transporter